MLLTDLSIVIFRFSSWSYILLSWFLVFVNISLWFFPLISARCSLHGAESVFVPPLHGCRLSLFDDYKFTHKAASQQENLHARVPICHFQLHKKQEYDKNVHACHFYHIPLRLLSPLPFRHLCPRRPSFPPFCCQREWRQLARWVQSSSRAWLSTLSSIWSGSEAKKSMPVMRSTSSIELTYCVWSRLRASLR